MKTKPYYFDLIDTTIIDAELFFDALERVSNLQKGLRGIGTLQEKSVHAVLKYYYASNTKHHEIPIEGYVADICCDGEIIEIQSKAFYTMKNKLNCFLKGYEVTIVYPIALTKYVRWIDPVTGEISAGRRSNKKGTIYNIIPELYSIREYLSCENLHFILCFIEMEEYKLLDGWSKDHKKGATKTDRIPTKLIGEFRLDAPDDLIKLLPDSLPDEFTSEDVKNTSGSSIEEARYLLTLLQNYELIKKIGTRKHMHLYKKL